jgi:hypothetical protein
MQNVDFILHDFWIDGCRYTIQLGKIIYDDEGNLGPVSFKSAEQITADLKARNYQPQEAPLLPKEK